MLKYFDLLFIKFYYWAISLNDKNTPQVSALILLSFLQYLNILFIFFLIKGGLDKNSWGVSILKILVICFSVLLLNYFRIFRIVGLKKFINKYEDLRYTKLLIHPVIYFLLSIALLVVLKLIGFFPSYMT